MAVETFEKVLGEHPFFRGLLPPDLETLVGCASNVTFDAGTFLFRAGDAADRFYVIRHGQAAVEIVAPGRAPVTIETVSAGEVLGWSWLFAPYKWHFDARAVSFVRALALDGACLRGKCETDPVLGRSVLERFAQVVVQRLEATQLQLLDLYEAIPEAREERPVLDPMGPVPFTVRQAVRETGDTFTLVLDPPTGAFPFAPGQFNMLYVFGVGEVPISISGDPAKPELLVHTIRAVGAATRALQRLSRGDQVGVRGPFGTAWPVDLGHGHDLVLVAGGIGLAPLRPALYHVLLHRGQYGRIALLYGARTPHDLLFTRELREWRGRFDLDVEVTVDRATVEWQGAVGVVTKLVTRAPFDPESAMAFLCGPEVMMRFAVLDLQKRGVAPSSLFVSMERNMKCGVGFCGHCQFGPTFICRDGPVFRYDRVLPLLGLREV